VLMGVGGQHLDLLDAARVGAEASRTGRRWSEPPFRAQRKAERQLHHV
jgi:hypothetical protein